MEIKITYVHVFIKWRGDGAKASHKAIKVEDRALLLPTKVQYGARLGL
jgi:hypothetical protein